VSRTIYGIKNCDTMKKARDWLAAHSLEVAFHDYKVSGIDEAHLKAWAAAVGWEKLLNRAGTTFKNLSDAEKDGIDVTRAFALMQAYPSLIKRPVLETDGAVLVGFKPEAYAAHFKV
jgi:arsenate reductase (glutaredoxin)